MHAIEQSHTGLLLISTFLNLICKFLILLHNSQSLAHLNNVHNIALKLHSNLYSSLIQWYNNQKWIKFIPPSGNNLLQNF